MSDLEAQEKIARTKLACEERLKGVVPNTIREVSHTGPGVGGSVFNVSFLYDQCAVSGARGSDIFKDSKPSQ